MLAEVAGEAELDAEAELAAVERRSSRRRWSSRRWLAEVLRCERSRWEKRGAADLLRIAAEEGDGEVRAAGALVELLVEKERYVLTAAGAPGGLFCVALCCLLCAGCCCCCVLLAEIGRASCRERVCQYV